MGEWISALSLLVTTWIAKWDTFCALVRPPGSFYLDVWRLDDLGVLGYRGRARRGRRRGLRRRRRPLRVRPLEFGGGWRKVGLFREPVHRTVPETGIFGIFRANF